MVQHVFFEGAKVRVLEKPCLGAIRLERRSEAFFVLSVPQGAPADAGEQFLKGRSWAGRNRSGILGEEVPDLSREELRLFCTEKLRAHILKSMPRLMELCCVSDCTWTLDCPRGRWGTCSREKRAIALNRSLCWMPPEVVDECIVHELNHFAVPDHARAFWERMTLLMPSWPFQEGILRNCREGVRHVYPV